MIDVIAVHQAPANLAKSNSMAELKSLFTEITGLNKVPSFSDKLAAAKRIFKEYAKAPKVTHIAEIPEPTGQVLYNEGDEIADVPMPCAPPAPVKSNIKSKDRTYTFKLIDNEAALVDNKMPKQMADILREFIDDSDDYSEVALQAVIQKIAEDGILVTKQPAWRIFQYYRPRMIKLGLLSVS